MSAGLRSPSASPSLLEEDDDNFLAEYLEAEVLSSESVADAASSEDTDETLKRSQKRTRVERTWEASIDTGVFSKIPLELFQNILKFLSSEDLVTCATVCQFLRRVASDESLWRRLYCLRWGLPSTFKQGAQPRGCAWKQLYFERDRADMIEFVRNTPVEFREYYIQMQAAKRSQAPILAQIKDDFIILDTTVAEQITSWRNSQGLPDVYLGNHVCSGRTCSYSQIGDVFLCEKTGRAHVCDETCREAVLDPSNDLLVCVISGRCFDHWLTAEEEDDHYQHMENNIVSEEAEEPFMGSGRLARAYSLGYNCNDEKELEAALREVVYPGSGNQKGWKRKLPNCCR
ncbi:hypothetical protein KP509_10G060600 [Ceratopteris richardii]|uniref:F-box domain-containing protein n=1 Tax=Ceratopteris richardii TaxID=49495 RepID=A0A8T2TY09_CERRI|nr:hypothetical protein KP509_10G060600 [Ceratopteris richardii]KAH7427801.1 hypothetical protein KP509_10G060600 [Ceratopteris richardii]KAH7427802.1 hypothetical protein KP509_10G060600 [Ceratopteris richardii]